MNRYYFNMFVYYLKVNTSQVLHSWLLSQRLLVSELLTSSVRTLKMYLLSCLEVENAEGNIKCSLKTSCLFIQLSLRMIKKRKNERKNEDFMSGLVS